MQPLLTDLNAIAALAAQRRDDFEVMRYQLQYNDDLTDTALDAFVDAIAAPIVAAIDCTQCAHCCRVLDVYLMPDDVSRLASGLQQPIQAVTKRYVHHQAAQQVGEWGKLRGKPCPFLRGKLCNVYTHRPQTCRLYPQFTPDFRWVLDDLIDGAALCPIIYHVLSGVHEQMDALYQ